MVLQFEKVFLSKWSLEASNYDCHYFAIGTKFGKWVYDFSVQNKFQKFIRKNNDHYCFLDEVHKKGKTSQEILAEGVVNFRMLRLTLGLRKHGTLLYYQLYSYIVGFFQIHLTFNHPSRLLIFYSTFFFINNSTERYYSIQNTLHNWSIWSALHYFESSDSWLDWIAWDIARWLAWHISFIEVCSLAWPHIFGSKKYFLLLFSFI